MSFQTPSGQPVGGQGFSTPDQFPQSSYDLQANLGALVLVTVRGIEDNVTTRLGDKPAARVSIDTLDGPNGGTHEPDVLLFPQALLRVCRSAHDQARGGPAVILGRIGQGQPEAGKNPPWILLEPSYQDVEMAKAFQARQSGQAQPQQPQAPAGPGWATTTPAVGQPYPMPVPNQGPQHPGPGGYPMPGPGPQQPQQPQPQYPQNPPF